MEMNGISLHGINGMNGMDVDGYPLTGATALQAQAGAQAILDKVGSLSELLQANRAKGGHMMGQMGQLVQQRQHGAMDDAMNGMNGMNGVNGGGGGGAVLSTSMAEKENAVLGLLETWVLQLSECMDGMERRARQAKTHRKDRKARKNSLKKSRGGRGKGGGRHGKKHSPRTAHTDKGDKDADVEVSNEAALQDVIRKIVHIQSSADNLVNLFGMGQQQQQQQQTNTQNGTNRSNGSHGGNGGNGGGEAEWKVPGSPQRVSQRRYVGSDRIHFDRGPQEAELVVTAGEVTSEIKDQVKAALHEMYGNTVMELTV